MYSVQFNASYRTQKHVTDRPREAFAVWNVRSWVGIDIQMRYRGSQVWFGPAFAGLAVERLYDEVIFMVRGQTAIAAGHQYFIDFSDTGIVPPPIDTSEQYLFNHTETAVSGDYSLKVNYPLTIDLTGAAQRLNTQHTWLLPTRLVVTTREIAISAKTERADETARFFANHGGGTSTVQTTTKAIIYTPNQYVMPDGDPFDNTNGGSPYQASAGGKWAVNSFNNAGGNSRQVLEKEFRLEGYFHRWAYDIPVRYNGEPESQTVDLNLYGRLCRDIPWRIP